MRTDIELRSTVEQRPYLQVCALLPDLTIEELFAITHLVTEIRVCKLDEQHRSQARQSAPKPSPELKKHRAKRIPGKRQPRKPGTPRRK